MISGILCGYCNCKGNVCECVVVKLRQLSAFDLTTTSRYSR